MLLFFSSVGREQRRKGMDHKIEQEAFQEVLRSSRIGTGTVVLCCPKCYANWKEYKTDVDGFNKYAFKTTYGDPICVTIEMCPTCWDNRPRKY